MRGRFKKRYGRRRVSRGRRPAKRRIRALRVGYRM